MAPVCWQWIVHLSVVYFVLLLCLTAADNNVCRPCAVGCLVCQGQADTCSKCVKGYDLELDQCVLHCAEREFKNNKERSVHLSLILMSVIHTVIQQITSTNVKLNSCIINDNLGDWLAFPELCLSQISEHQGSKCVRNLLPLI